MPAALMKVGFPVQVLVERFLLLRPPLLVVAVGWGLKQDGDLEVSPYFCRPEDGFTNFGTFTVWLIIVVISAAAA